MWFPIFKLVAAVLLVLVNIWLYKKKNMRLAAVITIILILIMWFSPIKYDGTSVDKERTAEEEVRSDAANRKVYDEVIK